MRPSVSATPEGYLDGDPLLFVQQEAGGVQHATVAQAREPLLRLLVGQPGGHGGGVLEALEPVLLGLVIGLAQPCEVVGDAARTLGAAGALLPRIVAAAALRDARRARQRDGQGPQPVGA